MAISNAEKTAWLHIGAQEVVQAQTNGAAGYEGELSFTTVPSNTDELLTKYAMAYGTVRGVLLMMLDGTVRDSTWIRAKLAHADEAVGVTANPVPKITRVPRWGDGGNGEPNVNPNRVPRWGCDE